VIEEVRHVFDNASLTSITEGIIDKAGLELTSLRPAGTTLECLQHSSVFVNGIVAPPSMEEEG
jgi:hypothetical protein